MTEVYKCPRCIDETLIRFIGNLLICGSCDAIFVEPQNINHLVTAEVLTIEPKD